MHAEEVRLLTPREAATQLHIPERFLARLRHEGRGPRYHKVGRYVRYDVRAIDTWLTENAHNATVEYGRHARRY